MPHGSRALEPERLPHRGAAPASTLSRAARVPSRPPELIRMLTQLQRTAGNRAVTEMLDDAAKRSVPTLQQLSGGFRPGSAIVSAVERARVATGDAVPSLRAVQRQIEPLVVQRALPVIVEGLEVALTATIVVQEGAMMAAGGRMYESSTGDRMGDPPQPTDEEYRARVLTISMTDTTLPNLQAVFDVRWGGNQYGEMGGAVVQLDMANSTSFSRSSVQAKFTVLRTMPKHGQDARLWPMVWIYEGNFDPIGRGDFDFQGRFEIDAFGGFRVTEHAVIDRSLVSFGNAEDFVMRGPNHVGSTPPPPGKRLWHPPKGRQPPIRSGP
jgi:hypothetical protein